MRSSLGITWLLIAMLSGCVIERAEPTKQPETVVLHSLPTPVWPDACVSNWYAKTSLPPCVESWITDITRQQNRIAAKRKKKFRSQRVLTHADTPRRVSHGL